MKKFVVDASVCLKWVFEEEDSEAARSLLNGRENGTVFLLAPSLWEYEIINALAVAVRRKKISSRKSSDLFAILWEARPEIIGLSDQAKSCLENAKRYGISGYDSAYVTLAMENNIILVSADARLVRSINDPSVAVLLADPPIIP